MSADRYADINNGRAFPALSRVDAYKYARRILQSRLGSPKECAPRVYAVSDAQGGHEEVRQPTRADLMRVFRRYLSDTRQHGSSKGLGRTCWAATKPTCGHDKGWGRLIHDVSHMLMEYRHPTFRPHDPPHDQIERDVIVYCELQGFLTFKPKPPKPTPAARSADKLARLNARLAKWLTRRKRCETAVRKLTRQIKAQARRDAARAVSEVSRAA